MIQHIVLFTPKPELSREERRSFARTVVTTLSQASDVSRVSVGRRVEIDAGYGRSFGEDAYEYSAVLEFTDGAALVRYLNSGDHAELGRLFWQNCARCIVSEVDVVDRLDDNALDTLV